VVVSGDVAALGGGMGCLPGGYPTTQASRHLSAWCFCLVITCNPRWKQVLAAVGWVGSLGYGVPFPHCHAISWLLWHC
jgi:hypothetical protein